MWPRNETIHFVCACEIEISASMWVGLNAGMGSEEICISAAFGKSGWLVCGISHFASCNWLAGIKISGIVASHLVSFLMHVANPGHGLLTFSISA